ncbi:GNAT family N-acetyltransferase [Leifsonia shinshuensis]|uniref:GNAT family N-acetyltransferase n=1 Tax=Leifsonia shinshuensis TaxID=150026 RepID=UPI002863F8A8|nr:GNAT family N-acetyltransferase [Leifsonia shinshuensis]MDR6970585.1 GNAT superfamily N-acetyltransferase [Leifsonia shinshuensis]
MGEIEIRAANPDEWEAVGGLRWDSVTEFGGEALDSREEFAARFAEWAAQHRDRHECLVAVADGAVVGMMWLARVDRVPSARAFDRSSGDLQCAYVVPELRNAGVGGRLIDAVVERARELGLERVTVHSSPRAVPVYERHGFAAEGRLLHVYVVHPEAPPARR